MGVILGCYYCHRTISTEQTSSYWPHRDMPSFSKPKTHLVSCKPFFCCLKDNDFVKFCLLCMLHATPYLFIMQDTGASQPSAPSPGTASAAAVPQPPSYQTVTSPHYAVVNYSQKTSPGGTSTGSTSGGALSQRSSKSSNRTGSSGSVGVTGVGNDSREPTPPPIPPHPPSEVNDNQNNHVTTNMQPIPQVSR